ncbi:PREDICTED: uncharacterized protein LOC105363016 [Ceratosolen solmsi marchali]|uniref:Uncharacterized protein LOC105363016 n=1 Tax=Ceratosolen solmsi marchali TaxID=326594 RepID=A0AAJ6YIV9_9HYME|nr:PREDICTED: uncharacterized protein LOC105363016 [Ceratosolen solmsi marchali]
MDMESLYDYGEEEQDFYEETPGARKGYPIDHRSIKRDARGVGGLLGCSSIAGGGIGGIGGMSGSGVMMMMAKYMKQELTSDAEEEGLVPNIPGRFAGAFAMRKVPSLSDLSDPESSLGKSPSYLNGVEVNGNPQDSGNGSSSSPRAALAVADVALAVKR